MVKGSSCKEAISRVALEIWFIPDMLIVLNECVTIFTAQNGEKNVL